MMDQFEVVYQSALCGYMILENDEPVGWIDTELMNRVI